MVYLITNAGNVADKDVSSGIFVYVIVVVFAAVWFRSSTADDHPWVLESESVPTLAWVSKLDQVYQTLSFWLKIHTERLTKDTYNLRLMLPQDKDRLGIRIISR